jgi:hypothetical protein
MEEKSLNEMNGWEKTWDVIKITLGCLAGIAWWVLSQAGNYHGHRGRCNTSSQGRSVWTVGSGGKKPGSWSSGRHR